MRAMVGGVLAWYDAGKDAAMYDDCPWTREELHALAWEAGKHLGLEAMHEYDDVPEKP
jgi:hypothetical protein